MKRLLLLALVVACGPARLDPFLYAPVKTNDYALSTSLHYEQHTTPSTDGVTL